MTEEDPVEEIEEMAKKEKPKAKARTAPAKKTKTKKTETAQAEEPKPSKQIVYKKLKVNFWRTRLHDEVIEVFHF